MNRVPDYDPFKSLNLEKHTQRRTITISFHSISSLSHLILSSHFLLFPIFRSELLQEIRKTIITSLVFGGAD